MEPSRLDLIAICSSAMLLVCYYLFLMLRVRSTPDFTIHALNRKVRALWVTDVMTNRTKDVMAVQTIRNFAMSATFMASSSILLIIGALTLSGQAESLSKTWHILSINGPLAAEWWIIKIICLLTVLIVAFFSFTTVIRLLNHVVFMINLPPSEAHGALAPKNVAERLNSAGVFYRIGMRAFFCTVPLVFWLFGPTFLMVATVGLVCVLYFLDRNPLAGQE